MITPLNPEDHPDGVLHGAHGAVLHGLVLAVQPDGHLRRRAPGARELPGPEAERTAGRGGRRVRPRPRPSRAGQPRGPLTAMRWLTAPLYTVPHPELEDLSSHVNPGVKLSNAQRGHASKSTFVNLKVWMGLEL